MTHSRRHLQLDREPYAGFTLIEVLVALMIFAIIATSVAYSLTLALAMTRDSRSREVAANLAAQQVDVVRSLKNVFSVVNGTTTQVVDGVTYTIAQSAVWVSSTGSTATCGTTGGLLQNKSVTESVTWSGMRSTTPPVQANTLLAPSGPLNDPTSGTILVHVTGATALGMSNVAVAAAPDPLVPGNGATTVTPAPSATDSDGCSYVLKVVPGSYQITVGSPGDGMISDQQTPTPTRTYPVSAASSVLASFSYDQAAQATVTYASNSVVAGLQLPSNLTATFLPQGNVYATAVTPAMPSKTATSPLFPLGSGYSVFAGSYVPTGPAIGAAPSCLSVNPAQWTTPNALGNVGVLPPAFLTSPGLPTVASAPMGIVTVNGVASGRYLTAVNRAAAASTGDPGCATGMSYTFTTMTSGAAVTLALPYGSWSLYASTSVTTSPASSSVVPVTSLVLPAGSPAATGANIFTLDPR